MKGRLELSLFDEEKKEIKKPVELLVLSWALGSRVFCGGSVGLSIKVPHNQEILPPFPSLCLYMKITALGFPGGAVVENLPANAGDMGSSPGLGRSHMPRSN